MTELFETVCGVAATSAAGFNGRALSFAAALWAWRQEQQPSPPPPVDAGGVNWLTYVWTHYLNRTVTVGNFSVSVVTLAEGVGVLLLALLVSRWLRGFIERRLANRRHIDPGTLYTLSRVTHYVIVSVGVVVALRLAFSADFTSLAVVFTALSVGIGFGLQYLAGDVASGFVLLFERPVRVGDYITTKGVDGKVMEGRVQGVNLRSTVVMTNDHIAVIVPNSKLVNESVVNWSYRERRSRISVPVGVSSDSDVDLVTHTLLRAAEGVAHTLEEPKPSVQFLGFGESALDFRLLVWTDRPRRHPQIRSDINYRIRRLFLEAGIEIPNPQRDLNVRGGTLRVETRGGGRLERDEEEQEVGYGGR